MGNITLGWKNTSTTVPRDYFCFGYFNVTNKADNFVLGGVANDNALYGYVEHLEVNSLSSLNGNILSTYWDPAAIQERLVDGHFLIGPENDWF